MIGEFSTCWKEQKGIICFGVKRQETIPLEDLGVSLEDNIEMNLKGIELEGMDSI